MAKVMQLLKRKGIILHGIMKVTTMAEAASQ